MLLLSINADSPMKLFLLTAIRLKERLTSCIPFSVHNQYNVKLITLSSKHIKIQTVDF